jgi:hypothetical protein
LHEGYAALKPYATLRRPITGSGDESRRVVGEHLSVTVDVGGRVWFAIDIRSNQAARGYPLSGATDVQFCGSAAYSQFGKRGWFRELLSALIDGRKLTQ